MIFRHEIWIRERYILVLIFVLVHDLKFLQNSDCFTNIIGHMSFLIALSSLVNRLRCCGTFYFGWVLGLHWNIKFTSKPQSAGVSNSYNMTAKYGKSYVLYVVLYMEHSNEKHNTHFGMHNVFFEITILWRQSKSHFVANHQLLTACSSGQSLFSATASCRCHGDVAFLVLDVPSDVDLSGYLFPLLRWWWYHLEC